MKVLVTGATGFVGKKICRELVMQGYELVITTRSKSRTQSNFPFPAEIIEWDYKNQDFPNEALEGVGSIIHLMGESIADGRWSSSRKKSLYESRVISTQKLVKAANGTNSVKSFISAGAIGFYPLSESEVFTEQSSSGNGFLQELCRDWEGASEDLKAEIRRVVFRIGLVIGHGGAMEKLEPLFSYGITSPLGSGKQWMSWVAVEDLVNMFVSAVSGENFEGTYNATSPKPVSNKDFHKALAKVFKRPMLPNTPGFLMKLVLGEMSQVVLGSQKVLPEKLVSQGFSFQYDDIKKCFEEMYPYGAFTKVVDEHQFLKNHDLAIFDFFKTEENLELLTPKFLEFKVLSKSTPEIKEGTIINYRLKLNGIPFKWKSEITRWKPPYMFADEQRKGPYKVWDHTHTFHEAPSGVMVSDKVYYKLPLAFFSTPIAGFKVKSDVRQIFGYRRKKMEEVFGGES